ncbi:MAG: tryptophan synthase subunit beta [Candidatus Sumerlaeota bacterium]|nr:tryptophan synthase subunit beta [Candidatus Sumerlaeota bacterium]
MKWNLFDFEREGYYGPYGGAFVPEILRATLDDLIAEFYAARKDPKFWEEYERFMQTYSCRPTPVTFLENLSRVLGGARIYVKREDLNHTGAHKANNVMGQGLLMRRMKKTRVIAETGAGQHGVATATMAARFGYECVIYMGAEDVARQRPNVFWMEQLGAKVVPVTDGAQTLKDAINECMRDWVATMDTTHYCLGTTCGPHPFPMIVAYFQSIIGKEARRQMLEQTGSLPARVYACVGGGSNAMGVFQGFLDDDGVELIGVEAGGKGLSTGQHATRLASEAVPSSGFRDPSSEFRVPSSESQIPNPESRVTSHEARIPKPEARIPNPEPRTPAAGPLPASVGIAQGYKTFFLQDEEGQMRDTFSVSAGLDYVGVSPILCYLKDRGRVRFESATDAEVIAVMRRVMRAEGLIPALESAHAFVQALKEAPALRPDQSILINQSGRGDKDIFTIADALDDPSWREFIIAKAERYKKDAQKA